MKKEVYNNKDKKRYLRCVRRADNVFCLFAVLFRAGLESTVDMKVTVQNQPLCLALNSYI